MSHRIAGSRVLAIMALSVFATAVLPPAGASWLNARRVAMTAARATAAASRLAAPRGGVVVCGPGRLPDVKPGRSGEQHAAWLAMAVVDPAAFGPGMPTDAWGRCFLMSDRWILSAGPNGAIETPRNAAALAGDDIGAVLK